MTASELFGRALARIPGGVNSPVRAFGSVGGEPFFAARAEGAHVWDTGGRRYVDEGGGLAMIGGDLSFSSGGWAATPVADILPVELLPEGPPEKFPP